MPLELTLSIARPTALVGGPIEATVTATNTAPAPVEAPDPSEMSPYEFGFCDADGVGRYALSPYGSIVERNQDSAVAPEYVNTALAPGASVSVAFDLAELAREPIAPGAYTVSVSWDSPAGVVVSPAVALTVTTPTVVDLGAAWCPGDQALTLAFAHVEPGGDSTVYQCSGALDRPLTGVAFPRDGIPAGVRAVTVASAVGLQPVAEARWYAALADQVLRAGIAQRKHLFARLAPTALPLHHASLHECGWQHTSDAATFLVAGWDDAGQLVMLAVTVDAEEETTVVAPFPTGIAARPTAWCARAGLRDEGRVVDVVLAFAGPDGASLYRVTLWPDTGALHGPSLITQYAEPIAAVAVDPVVRDLAGAVDVLFGPVGLDGRMTLARLALDGSATVALWHFNAPPHRDRARPDAWALASPTLDRPIVLASLSPRVYVLRVGDEAAWKELVDGRPDVAFLHAFAPEGLPPFALWVNQARGVEVRTLDG